VQENKATETTMGYPDTQQVQATATDGTVVNLTVPKHVPMSDERAELLRDLYRDHVKTVKPDESWKGACYAIVPAALVADMTASMDFMGSLVDEEQPVEGGMVKLESDGYWAHGF
jgi:hypothetical protein